MNELIPFTYGVRQIRVVVCDGEPWFVAADVCNVLGIRDTFDATRGLDDDEKGTDTIRTPGGPQSVTIVSEPGLYSLILRSRKPEAKAFKRWITHEVIPSIRKTGGYGQQHQVPQTYAEALELAARQTRELEAAQEHVAELEPAASSWNRLADATGDYSVDDAAKILCRDPAINTGQKRLFAYLRETGWLNRNGSPRQDQVNLGRMREKPNPYWHPHSGEHVLGKPQVRVTIKGLAELHRRMGGTRPLQLGQLTLLAPA